MTVQNLKIIWESIALDIIYDDDTFPSYRKVYGHGMGHITLKSEDKRQLPVSETGSRSRYIPDSVVKSYGGAEGYACAWLDDSAQAKEWKEYVFRSRQLTLF